MYNFVCYKNRLLIAITLYNRLYVFYFRAGRCNPNDRYVSTFHKFRAMVFARRGKMNNLAFRTYN